SAVASKRRPERSHTSTRSGAAGSERGGASIRWIGRRSARSASGAAMSCRRGMKRRTRRTNNQGGPGSVSTGARGWWRCVVCATVRRPARLVPNSIRAGRTYVQPIRGPDGLGRVYVQVCGRGWTVAGGRLVGREGLFGVDLVVVGQAGGAGGG